MSLRMERETERERNKSEGGREGEREVQGGLERGWRSTSWNHEEMTVKLGCKSSGLFSVSTAGRGNCRMGFLLLLKHLFTPFGVYLFISIFFFFGDDNFNESCLMSFRHIGGTVVGHLCISISITHDWVVYEARSSFCSECHIN